MGLFDYVCIKVICPMCGREIADFQTKDSACIMDYLLPGKSVVDKQIPPELRHLIACSYCEHEHITTKRFGRIEDMCGNTLWIDVRIPINKNGVLSKDVRKYEINYEEWTWNAEKMAKAPNPIYTLEPSEEVTTKNKIIEKLKLGGPYKPKISLDTKVYDARSKALFAYFKRIIEDSQQKREEVISYSKERGIIPTCDNCAYNKNNRCHFLENIPGMDMDFTAEIPESRLCCEWKEANIQTEW